MRDFLVHIDGDRATAASDRRRAYALSLAAGRQARLTGLVLTLEPTLYTGPGLEFPVQLFEQLRQTSLEAANTAADAFAQAARRGGVGYDVQVVATPGGSASRRFADAARTRDLAIVGQVGPDDPLVVRDLLIEGALFASGRPVLIHPHSGPGEARFGRALVAWDGGREASRAVHDALPLLAAFRAVEVLVVGTRARAARRAEPGADLALHLARYEIDATARHLPAGEDDIARTLMSSAADAGADMIVMGGYGRSRLREVILGGTTRSVLRHMEVPVFMSH